MTAPVLSIARAILRHVKIRIWSRFHAIPVEADPSLDGISRIVIVNGRPKILYNPEKLEKMGAAAEFVLWHEKGHVALGHTRRHVNTITPDEIRVMEDEADRYAARRAPKKAVLAIISHHLAEGGRETRRFHGTGFERARRIFIERFAA